MNKRNQILKCSECGFSVEVLTACECAECAVSCCGKPMAVLDEKTADSAVEKHVPVPHDTAHGGIKVVVGSVPHPMTEAHYIQWIEVINGDYINRKFLKPGDQPEAEFYVSKQKGMIIREHCNVHGLWKNEVK